MTPFFLRFAFFIGTFLFQVPSLLVVDTCSYISRHIVNYNMAEKRTLSLGNVPEDITSEEMKIHFLTSGKIEFAIPERDASTGKCTGKGYVVFSDDKSVATAIKDLANTPLKGNLLTLTTTPSSESAYISGLISGFSSASPVENIFSQIMCLTDEQTEALFQKLKGTKVKVQDVTPNPDEAISSRIHYQIPKLANFSGEKQNKGEICYSEWRYNVQCLINEKHPPQLITQAIRQSVRDTATKVLLSCEQHSPEKILETFDKRFGNILNVNQLTRNFWSSAQNADESVVGWSCRLQELISELKKFHPIQKDEELEMLRDRFWNGMIDGKVKDNTRDLYHSKLSFEQLLVSARSEEFDMKTEKGDSKKKSGIIHQASISNDETKLDKILKTVSALDSRLSQVEVSLSHGKSNYLQGKQKQQGQNKHDIERQSKTFSCQRCKRKNHVTRDCHARKDIYGKTLN